MRAGVDVTGHSRSTPPQASRWLHRLAPDRAAHRSLAPGNSSASTKARHSSLIATGISAAPIPAMARANGISALSTAVGHAAVPRGPPAYQPAPVWALLPYVHQVAGPARCLECRSDDLGQECLATDQSHRSLTRGSARARRRSPRRPPPEEDEGLPAAGPASPAPVGAGTPRPWLQSRLDMSTAPRLRARPTRPPTPPPERVHLSTLGVGRDDIQVAHEVASRALGTLLGTHQPALSLSTAPVPPPRPVSDWRWPALPGALCARFRRPQSVGT